MRPGDFSPGNLHQNGGYFQRVNDASMRPGDFSPGNGAAARRTPTSARAARFNEAGGFLPRKLCMRGRSSGPSSMLQ